MKKLIFNSLFTLMAGSTAMAQSVVNCVDGTRSMTVVKQNGVMVGQLNDFDLKLNNMKCGVIPNTKTVRCDKGDYYVVVFKVSSTQRLTAQVNLKGDFFPDSGYLHSLNCQ